MSVPFPTANHRRIVLHIDGLRYSFGMAKLAAHRLRRPLDEIADRHWRQQHSEDCVMAGKVGQAIMLHRLLFLCLLSASDVIYSKSVVNGKDI